MYELATVEAIGSNVEDAVARGLDALNATREQVTIEVLDEGGALAPGQRVREARVRLTLKPQPKPLPVERQEAPSVPPMSEEEVVRLAQQILQGMLDKLQVKASITARRAEAADEQDEREGPPLVLDVHGDDLGVLIGRRGETLGALQYLTRLIVSGKAGRGVGLVVDVEGYKARRAQQLRQLALRMAERVAGTRKPVALEPMPAHERRIIHLALRDHPIVMTESVGRDQDRKVTIILKSRRS